MSLVCSFLLHLIEILLQLSVMTEHFVYRSFNNNIHFNFSSSFSIWRLEFIQVCVINSKINSTLCTVMYFQLEVEWVILSGLNYFE